MAKREGTGALTPEAPKPAVPAPVAPEQPSIAVLGFKPADAAVPVGQEARFELTASSVKNLYGAIITLSYDPKTVEFKAASEGALLKKDNQQTSFLFSNNIKGGTVDLYMTRIGDVGGVDGEGGLGTLVFQGKAAGTADIVIKNVKLTNASREQMRTDSKGARMSVK
jgi:hypothetical protein